MEDKRALNEYLYYELSVDGSESEIAENWPFDLQYLGVVQQGSQQVTVYQFEDEEGQRCFAFSPEFNSYPTADMELDDLKLQMTGSAWIGSRDPIPLDTAFLGDESVPRSVERLRAIKRLALQASDGEKGCKILEGLYLRSTGEYVALLKATEQEAVIIGDNIEPSRVGFHRASSWQRLSIGIGQMISEGKLPDFKCSA